MLYIHGGAFISGSGSMETYNGVALAAYHDVIVVNFNYRLGVFGFLSTGDNELPGNYGMWDQLEALKWVKNHIADFGGDDDKITIFGESAGSASVSLMTLAKQSWGFYNRAIMQSGTASSPWSVLDPTTARDHAFKLGRLAQCGESISSSSLLSCLKQKSTSDLVVVMNVILRDAVKAKTNIIPFVPTIDREFLTENPAELYKRGEFKKTDVMIGTMRDEGAMIAFEAFLPRSILGDLLITEKIFDERLSDYIYIKHDQAMVDLIREHYVDPGQSKYFRPFSSLTGDEAFVCPTDAVAKAFASANSNTYLYQMTHVSSFHLLPLPFNDIVPHGDDLAYVFGSAFMQGLDRPVSLTEEEIGMSADMMRYWTNFAKTGNPNMESKRGVARVSSKTWHKFNAQTLYYKDLSPSMVDRQRLRQDECYLWNVQLPQMVPSERNEEVPSQQEITDDLPEPNNLPIPGNLLTIMLIGRN
ncbi:cholinesterase 2-like [Acanthaster planci]|uniref:Carboxylic ester hydrolase n=1 Tax=Acanthaster planci TaxID=133434 RepID=A0A8B7Z6B7_ACAPL|nr:cholinesterase 2-like [Acanthaster planci]